MSIINLSHKIQKACLILKDEGSNAFVRKVTGYFKRLFGPLRPNESCIVFHALQADQRRGVMIDVGAHFGSSLAPFAHYGWEVYAFEPDFDNRNKLIKSFGHFENVSIDPRALADQAKTDMTFYKSTLSTGISGLSAFHPSHTEHGTVDTTTLKMFSEEKGITSIDFLKIDTEGFDLFVLKGIPWDKLRPRVILCEFDDFKTESLGYTFHDIIQFLQKHSYRLVISEWFPIKKYGLSHDWRCFAPYPYELQDKNGWGNIFAAGDSKMFEALIESCNTVVKSRPFFVMTSSIKRSLTRLF